MGEIIGVRGIRHIQSITNYRSSHNGEFPPNIPPDVQERMRHFPNKQSDCTEYGFKQNQIRLERLDKELEEVPSTNIQFVIPPSSVRCRLTGYDLWFGLGMLRYKRGEDHHLLPIIYDDLFLERANGVLEPENLMNGHEILKVLKIVKYDELLERYSDLMPEITKGHIPNPELLDAYFDNNENAIIQFYNDIYALARKLGIIDPYGESLLHVGDRARAAYRKYQTIFKDPMKASVVISSQTFFLAFDAAIREIPLGKSTEYMQENWNAHKFQLRNCEQIHYLYDDTTHEVTMRRDRITDEDMWERFHVKY